MLASVRRYIVFAVSQGEAGQWQRRRLGHNLAARNTDGRDAIERVDYHESPIGVRAGRWRRFSAKPARQRPVIRSVALWTGSVPGRDGRRIDACLNQASASRFHSTLIRPVLFPSCADMSRRAVSLGATPCAGFGWVLAFGT